MSAGEIAGDTTEEDVRMKAFRLLSVIFVLGLGEPAWAGWTQQENAYYAKVWTRALVGSQGFFQDGETRSVSDFTDVNVSGYLEYGLTSRWTLVGFATPFGYADVDSSTGYIGPLGVGARLGLLTGDLKLALEARYAYRPNVGTDVVGQGVSEGQPWFYQPTVETHQVDGEVQLGYGLPFGWVRLTGGIRGFSRNFLDPAVIASAQLGYSSGDFVADVHFNLFEQLGDVELTNVSGAGETRYLGIGLTFAYWFSKQWGVGLTPEGVLYARGNAATPSLMLSLEHRSAS